MEGKTIDRACFFFVGVNFGEYINPQKFRRDKLSDEKVSEGL